MTGGGEGFRRFHHRAMATVFEIMIAGEDPAFSAGAARAAFEEIDRLEQDLSRYSGNSDITRINNLPPGGSVCVGLDTFTCLRLSRRYWEETRGAFDITLGALMQCWLGKDLSLLHPSPEDVERAKARSGMQLLELDDETMKVRVQDSVPIVDLGAVGKGYAVDQAAGLLKDWGITSALVHGGTSSVFGFGEYAAGEGWPVTLSHPLNPSEVLEKVFLKGEGLGGSGTRKGRHIIDPRRAAPVEGRRAAWVSSESATKSDAFSTACMIMTREEIAGIIAADLHSWAMVVEGETGEIVRFGRGAAV
jgi:thiamine biosynthesis lipoprotein